MIRRLVVVAMALLLASCAQSSSQPSSSTSTRGTTSAAPSNSQPTVSAPSTPFTPRTVTTVMSGDLLWHNTTYMGLRTGKPAGSPDEFDFSKMFAQMKTIIAGADLAICHEEVPFAKKGGPYLNYPVFAAPPQIATMIKQTGWDACTLASNHAVDQGVPGLIRTNTALREAGVLPVGTFRSEAETRQPVIFTTANGVRIGLVSGTYSLNGFQLPADQQWAVSMWKPDNLLAQARRAKQAGADIVMVDMHGGVEYQTAPSAEQVAIATKLTASPDVDLVYGEHVHVVQPITKINGKWVVYGMGNMVAQQLPSMTRSWEGMTVRFTFTETAPRTFTVTKAEYIQTIITSAHDGPVRVLPVLTNLKNGTGPTDRLKQSEARTRAAVSSLGAPPGLVES